MREIDDSISLYKHSERRVPGEDVAVCLCGLVSRRGDLIFEEGILGNLVSSLSSLQVDIITVFVNVKIWQHDLSLHLNTFESYYRMQEDLQESSR